MSKHKLAQDLSTVFSGRSVLLTKSGSAAIVLTLLALRKDLPNRDEVLIPAICCPAVLFAVQFAGLTPVLVDTRPETLNSSAEDFAQKTSGRTLAIIAVHGFGALCDLPGIAQVAKQCGAAIIEDACLSFTSLGSENVDATILSLGYDKPISVPGGGGVTIVKPGTLLQKMEHLANENKFLCTFDGDIQLASEGITCFPAAYAERLANTQTYVSQIDPEIIRFRPDAPEIAWWRLSGLIRVNRDKFIADAADNDIVFSRHYRSLANLSTGADLPGAAKIDAQIINLFIRPGTPAEEIARNIKFINRYAP